MYRSTGFDAIAPQPAGIHAGVVQGIGRRIVRGELAPGDILPEQGELSRMLGVSRTVIREATKVLAAKGLVESRSKRGTVVLPRSDWRLLDPDVLAWLSEAGLDPEFLRSMFEVRKIIEPAAVRLAAERATPEELAAIQSTFEAMAGPTTRRPTSTPTSATTRCSSRRRTTTTWSSWSRRSGRPSRPACARRRGHGWDWPDFLEYSIGPHREVLDAVMAHDRGSGRARPWNDS